jgi:hypothetical protein
MAHVRYIDKTREYYLAQGYDKPYHWAHFDDIPFTPLAKPLAECRVGLVTTSELVVEGDPDVYEKVARGRDVYALPTDVPVSRLRSAKEAYDRYATTLEDVDAYMPLTHLRALVDEGRLGGIAPRMQIIFSEYSQRKTSTVDAPEILRQMREDGVDVALLIAV